MRSLVFSCLILIGQMGLKAQDGLEPRTILALYDGRVSEHPVFSLGHDLAEMPLNHLGLVVRHVDVNRPLPDPHSLTEVRGVLMWLESGEMRDPESFLGWAGRLADAGVRFVIFGELAFLRDLRNRTTARDAVNGFLERIGLYCRFEWNSITYDLEILELDPNMIGFERPISGVLSAFEQIVPIDRRSETLLKVGLKGYPERTGHLGILTPFGGYVASGYTHYEQPDQDRRRWIIDPFRFFRRAFDTADLPKPDTTTHCGRRIYYSHIDGDGWNNLTEIPAYRRNPTLAAEVVLEEALKPFPHLPVTIGPVVADLDPEWFGKEGSLAVAERVFALPQVEIGSHTLSHPFYWKFFEEGDPEKERPFLEQRSRNWSQKGAGSRIAALYTLLKPVETASLDLIHHGHKRPRAFAVKPFDLTEEIVGAAKFLEQVAPSGKRTEVIQWSGDTLPFEEALRMARLAGLANINGGDTRFDREYASVSWVAPIGRAVGEERQIYSSNSNENTYTDLWTGRYFGFLHLIRTFLNTETPIRLKPLNLYYHMYSGERLSSLNALMANLRYVSQQEICALRTSQFARIGDGFFTTKLRRLAKDSWEVLNRGWLQTIRFDRSVFKQVDFRRSNGVVGQRHYQGSLYVMLDRRVDPCTVTLKSMRDGFREPLAPIPYLIEANWDVWDFQTSLRGFRFQSQGYGRGEMRWKCPDRDQPFQVTLTSGKRTTNQQYRSNRDGELELRLHAVAIEPVEVRVERLQAG